MFQIFRKEMMWGDKPLVLETGRIARQADGAVLVSYGETTVLCTVVGQKKVSPTADFFPLTVNYQEKYYAAGRIPGGFNKREGRPADRETLTSRLIDRPIRPLFIEGFRNEVQVICKVLSYDRENNGDIAAMIGASAALTLSGLPFLGPIGGARVGVINGEFVLNPTVSQLKDSDLDLVVAGTKDGVLMVESEANELSEAKMLEAVMFGHKAFQPVIDAIIEMAGHCAKEPWEIESKRDEHDQYYSKIKKMAEKDITSAYKEVVKKDRVAKLNTVRDSIAEEFSEDELAQKMALSALSELESNIVRGSTLKTKKRIDGRGLKDIRQIVSQAAVLNRTHGSALFTRGETQALVVTTLGTSSDEQLIDHIGGEYKERFLLHYNFPPYSVGETGRTGSPGRREIGHGELARRALKAVIPSKEAFPYSLRIVSEITESNGSSSMATVCGSALSMMDAGVPIKAPVAGIAMGLIKEGDDFAVLSDILGDEDHLGDMDFKVAGTENGVTALQMDLKITSINEDIMRVALDQAKEGRLHILGEMNKALDAPREELNRFAPQMTTFKVAKDKIRDIIGPGGSMIRGIVEATGAKVDINDDGEVTVAAVDAESSDKAIAMIRDIVAEPEMGEVYSGPVTKLVDFGVFIRFLGQQEGLVHVSELGVARGDKVENHYKLGDVITVKVIGFDRGKPRFKVLKDEDKKEEDKKASENTKAE